MPPCPRARTSRLGGLARRRTSLTGAVAKLVSATDKVRNAKAILADYRDLGENLLERFNCKRDGTLWYYRELVKAFRDGGRDGLRRLIDELERIVSKRVAGVTS